MGFFTDLCHELDNNWARYGVWSKQLVESQESWPKEDDPTPESHETRPQLTSAASKPMIWRPYTMDEEYEGPRDTALRLPAEKPSPPPQPQKRKRRQKKKPKEPVAGPEQGVDGHETKSGNLTHNHNADDDDEDVMDMADGSGGDGVQAAGPAAEKADERKEKVSPEDQQEVQLLYNQAAGGFKGAMKRLRDHKGGVQVFLQRHGGSITKWQQAGREIERTIESFATKLEDVKHRAERQGMSLNFDKQVEQDLRSKS